MSASLPKCRKLPAHLSNGDCLDTHHPPSSDLEVRARRDNQRTFPTKLNQSIPYISCHLELTSRVLGVSVLAAAPATIFPTFPDPVKSTEQNPSILFHLPGKRGGILTMSPFFLEQLGSLDDTAHDHGISLGIKIFRNQLGDQSRRSGSEFRWLFHQFF